MADGPRVVSLAPSATATLSAMGAADLVVGVTVHCDLDRPVVGGWLNPDIDRLADLDPDVVCTSDDLQTDIRDELRDEGFTVHHTAPATLDDALSSFEAIGAAVGRPEAGALLAANCRERLDTVADDVAGRERPVVYCEEWSDPPMAAGNWVPDAVEAAGGAYPFVAPGDRSREVSESTVVAADPDHVVLHICGHGDGVSPATVDRREWDIDAPIHVLDDALLNQPSPRLVDGIERLAGLLHGTTPTGEYVTVEE